MTDVSTFWDPYTKMTGLRVRYEDIQHETPYTGQDIRGPSIDKAIRGADTDQDIRRHINTDKDIMRPQASLHRQGHQESLHTDRQDIRCPYTDKDISHPDTDKDIRNPYTLTQTRTSDVPTPTRTSWIPPP